MSNTKTPSRCCCVRRCKNIFFRNTNQIIAPFFDKNKEKRTIKAPFVTKRRLPTHKILTNKDCAPHGLSLLLHPQIAIVTNKSTLQIKR